MAKISHNEYGGFVYVIDDIKQLADGQWQAVGSIGQFDGDEYIPEVTRVTAHNAGSAMGAGQVLEARIKALIDEKNKDGHA